MEKIVTIFWVLGLLIFVLASGWATLTYKDMRELDDLIWFAKKCQRTSQNHRYILEEIKRLSGRGLVPEKKINELALITRKRFNK